MLLRGFVTLASLCAASGDTMLVNCAAEEREVALELDAFTCEHTKVYKCLHGSPALRPAPMPVNLTVGMIGDQGVSEDSVKVLEMIRDEGAHVVTHAGDISYTAENQPGAWINQQETALGKIPMLAVMGNHDSGEALPGWTYHESYEAIHYFAHPLGTCAGLTGAQFVCTFHGITMVFISPGVWGKDHDRFVAWAFQKYPSQWRMCVWHKNQQAMQPGSKGDATGWEVYEECRRQGAFIQTAHEHQYARTFEMSSYIKQTVTHKNASAPVKLQIETEDQVGTSACTVSGVGGYSIRHRGKSGKNPWWAKSVGQDSGLGYGALMCKFNYNGQMNKAYCYFKDLAGMIHDEFFLESSMPPKPKPITDIPDTETEEKAPREVDTSTGEIKRSFLEVQISDGSDDATQVIGYSLQSCSYKKLTLGMMMGRARLVALRFTDIPLKRHELKKVIAARIDFVSSESTSNGKPASFTIHAELTPKPKKFCSSEKLVERAWTSRNISWEEVERWDGVDESIAPGQVGSTPDISDLIREVADDTDWKSGSTLAFYIIGTGSRSAVSYNSDECAAPTLIIEYDSGCSSDGEVQMCEVHNGNGTTTCSNGAWGECVVERCQNGLLVRDNKCVVCTAGDSKPCDVEHGTGVAKCKNKEWDECVATQCKDGYEIVQDHCQSKPWAKKLSVDVLPRHHFEDEEDWTLLTDTDMLAAWNTSFTDGFQFTVIRPGVYIYFLQLRPKAWFLIDEGWRYQVILRCRGRPAVPTDNRDAIVSISDSDGDSILYRKFTMGEEYEDIIADFAPAKKLRTPVDMTLNFGNNLGASRSWGQCESLRVVKYLGDCVEGERRKCSKGYGLGRATCKNGMFQPCHVEECLAGFLIVNGSCVDCIDGKAKKCSIENGVGASMCKDGEWADCKLLRCNSDHDAVDGMCLAHRWESSVSEELLSNPDLRNARGWSIYSNVPDSDWDTSFKRSEGFRFMMVAPGPKLSDIQLSTTFEVAPNENYQLFIQLKSLEKQVKRSMYAGIYSDARGNYAQVMFQARVLEFKADWQNYTFNLDGEDVQRFFTANLVFQFGMDEMGVEGSGGIIRTISIRKLLPTESPTGKPSVEPTSYPSASPTVPPTAKPTKAPTPYPSKSPSVTVTTTRATTTTLAPIKTQPARPDKTTTSKADGADTTGTGKVVTNSPKLSPKDHARLASKCVVEALPGELYYYDSCKQTNGFELYWSLKRDNIQLALKAKTKGGWLALGISPDGGMEGSDAAIASARNDDDTPGVHHYFLGAKRANGVTRVPTYNGVPGLENQTIVFVDDKTTMTFVRPLSFKGPSGLVRLSEEEPVSFLFAMGPPVNPDSSRRNLEGESPQLLSKHVMKMHYDVTLTDITNIKEEVPIDPVPLPSSFWNAPLVLHFVCTSIGMTLLPVILFVHHTFQKRKLGFTSQSERDRGSQTSASSSGGPKDAGKAHFSPFELPAIYRYLPLISSVTFLFFLVGIIPVAITDLFNESGTHLDSPIWSTHILFAFCFCMVFWGLYIGHFLVLWMSPKCQEWNQDRKYIMCRSVLGVILFSTGVFDLFAEFTLAPHPFGAALCIGLFLMLSLSVGGLVAYWFKQPPYASLSTKDRQNGSPMSGGTTSQFTPQASRRPSPLSKDSEQNMNPQRSLKYQVEANMMAARQQKMLLNQEELDDPDSESMSIVSTIDLDHLLDAAGGGGGRHSRSHRSKSKSRSKSKHAERMLREKEFSRETSLYSARASREGRENDTDHSMTGGSTRDSSRNRWNPDMSNPPSPDKLRGMPGPRHRRSSTSRPRSEPHSPRHSREPSGGSEQNNKLKIMWGVDLSNPPSPDRIRGMTGPSSARNARDRGQNPHFDYPPTLASLERASRMSTQSSPPRSRSLYNTPQASPTKQRSNPNPHRRRALDMM